MGVRISAVRRFGSSDQNDDHHILKKSQRKELICEGGGDMKPGQGIARWVLCPHRLLVIDGLLSKHAIFARSPSLNGDPIRNRCSRHRLLPEHAIWSLFKQAGLLLQPSFLFSNFLDFLAQPSFFLSNLCMQGLWPGTIIDLYNPVQSTRHFRSDSRVAEQLDNR